VACWPCCCNTSAIKSSSWPGVAHIASNYKPPFGVPSDARSVHLRHGRAPTIPPRRSGEPFSDTLEAFTICHVSPGCNPSTSSVRLHSCQGSYSYYRSTSFPRWVLVRCFNVPRTTAKLPILRYTKASATMERTDATPRQSRPRKRS